MAAITDKATYYRLRDAGLLGNRPVAWPSAEALAASGYAGNVSVRYMAPGANAFKKYHTPAEEALRWVHHCVGFLGARRELFQFSESMPDDRCLVQGQVHRVPGGLDLQYGLGPATMPEALAQRRFAEGSAAALILRSYMDPDSYEEVNAFLDRYEDHVVEFGCYECPVGVVPGRNTVIWEVRKY